MTVLDILASTEINSLARGCAFSYRLSHIGESIFEEHNADISIVHAVLYLAGRMLIDTVRRPLLGSAMEKINFRFWGNSQPVYEELVDT